jgi:CubicO group peptidase (beta-lactamase class C family)
MIDYSASYRHLDIYIQQEMRVAIPGLALAIVDRDQLLHSATYGYASLEANTPIRADTLFEIGSISKSFTSILLLQLAEQGRLDLAAPVQQYLPWFVVPSSHAPFAAHHLMSHTAGLIRGSFAPGSRYDVLALRETVAAWAPGERYHYSNVGYQALGYLLEDLLGRPFPDILRAQLLEPLGMHASAPAITHALRPRLATGYTSLCTDRPLAEPQTFAPAPWFEYGLANGSIATTAGDMASYLRMLLNRGLGPHGRIMDEASFDLLTQRLVQQPWGSYGYGLATWEMDGHIYIEHGGATVGFAAQLMCDMDDGLGVILLTNAPGWVGFQLWQMAAFILGSLRAARSQQPPPPIPSVEDATSIAAAADYAGVYRCGARRLEIVAEDGRLRAKSQDTDALLAAHGADTFAVIDAPDLDRFLLRFGRSGEDIVEVDHGSDWYVNDRYTGPTQFDYPQAWEAYPGHYRAHTPWLPDFRIVLRKGALYLVYWWGQEVPLVPAEPGGFQISEGGHPSEVIVFDSVVAGRAQRAHMEGCMYYRFFTP